MDSPFLGTIVAWPISWAPQGWLFCEGQVLYAQQYQALYSLIGNTYGGSAPTTFCLPDLRYRTIIGMNRNSAQYPQVLPATVVGTTQVDPILLAHSHVLPTSGMTVDLTKGSVNVSVSEMTVNSTGTYGLPLTAESVSPTTLPTTSDYYLGTPKMPNGTGLNAYYKPASDPTVTTKPTTITVTGKATPSVSATIAGTAPVVVPQNTPVSISGVPSGKMSVMQPSLAMGYIIAVEGLYPPRPY